MVLNICFFAPPVVAIDSDPNLQGQGDEPPGASGSSFFDGEQLRLLLGPVI
jgi:hypothetical protein